MDIHPSIWHDAMIWKRAKPIGLRTYVDPREVEWILMHELRICTAVPIYRLTLLLVSSVLNKKKPAYEGQQTHEMKYTRTIS
jgi:hypothetical protein